MISPPATRMNEHAEQPGLVGALLRRRRVGQRRRAAGTGSTRRISSGPAASRRSLPAWCATGRAPRARSTPGLRRRTVCRRRDGGDARDHPPGPVRRSACPFRAAARQRQRPADRDDSDAAGAASPACRKGVPTIVFHGDKDTTVHPSNGEGVIRQAREEAGALAGFTRAGRAHRRGRPALHPLRSTAPPTAASMPSIGSSMVPASLVGRHRRGVLHRSARAGCIGRDAALLRRAARQPR